MDDSVRRNDIGLAQCQGARGGTQRVHWRACLLVLVSLSAGWATAARATAASPVTLEQGGEGVRWKSLVSDGFAPEWGYKIAISKVERGCSPDPKCRETEYFEVQRSTDPQEYIPYAQNLGFTPEGKDVYIGVGALAAQGTSPPSYSEELKVPVVGGKVPGDPAPSRLWTEGDSVLWEAVGRGEWGYKVAISNRPRCFTSECRGTEFAEVLRSSGAESYSPCLAKLHFKPIDDTVFVGIGTIQSPGESPLSYTGSEVAVTVPECPPPTVLGGAPSAISETTAALNGTINPNGNGVSDCHFDYGASAAYGASASCASLPASGSSTVPVTAQLTGLSAGTSYHFRIVATGVSGTSYGADQSFSTLHPPVPPPVDIVAPSIGGKAVAGYSVTASPGIWEHGPAGYAYRWQLCDASGGACADTGAASAQLALTSVDVGHRLRLSVTASNAGGSAVAVSAPSSIVGSKVEAKLEWTFNWFARYTVVEALHIIGIPPGGVVEVACRGRGCPFALAHVAPLATGAKCHSRHCRPTRPSPAGSSLNVASIFKRRHLRPGTVISVRVVRAGWVGRSVVFTVLANRTPVHRSACLAPGSTQPGQGC
jgi:hypothetical protein